MLDVESFLPVLRFFTLIMDQLTPFNIFSLNLNVICPVLEKLVEKFFGLTDEIVG